MGFCYCLLLQSTMRKNKKVIKRCNNNYSSIIYKIESSRGDYFDAAMDGGKYSTTDIPQ